MKHAQPNVRGESRPTGDDRITEGWSSPQSPPPTGRGVLVAHLKAPANRGETGSIALPGIDVVDLEAPGSEPFLDAIVGFDGLSLEAAAFLVGGFYVDPTNAARAIERLPGLLEDKDPSALRIRAALDWLRIAFATDDSGAISQKRLIISPADLITALHERPDAPETSLGKLLLAAYQLALAKVSQHDEAMALARLKWNLADDEMSGSTSNSRKALFLLAVEAGLVAPKGRFSHGVTAVKAALAEGYKKVKAAHPAVAAKPEFSEDSLGDYLKTGAKELGVDPKGPPGRPPRV